MEITEEQLDNSIMAKIETEGVAGIRNILVEFGYNPASLDEYLQTTKQFENPSETTALGWLKSEYERRKESLDEINNLTPYPQHGPYSDPTNDKSHFAWERLNRRAARIERDFDEINNALTNLQQGNKEPAVRVFNDQYKESSCNVSLYFSGQAPFRYIVKKEPGTNKPRDLVAEKVLDNTRKATLFKRLLSELGATPS